MKSEIPPPPIEAEKTDFYYVSKRCLSLNASENFLVVVFLVLAEIANLFEGIYDSQVDEEQLLRNPGKPIAIMTMTEQLISKWF